MPDRSTATKEICPYMPGCEMHTDLSASNSGFWRAMYCEARFRNCARYKYKELGCPVPKDLLPNGKRKGLQSPSV